MKSTPWASSPDGQFLATIHQGQDRATGKPTSRVMVWEIATGKERLAQPVYWNYVRADPGLCSSPDSKRLATLDQDRTIKLWDMNTGQQRAAYRAVDSPVNDMVFAPDGRHLVVGCWDGIARLLEASSGRVIHNWKGHTLEICRVALSADGKYLASASADRTVMLWAVSERVPAALAIEGHTQPVRGIAFSPDGRRLAAAGDPHTVRMREAVKGQALPGIAWRPEDNLPGMVQKAAFSGDGKVLFAAAGEVMDVPVSPSPAIAPSPGKHRSRGLWDAPED